MFSCIFLPLNKKSHFYKGKDEAAVEEWIEIADIIADPETNKKERMVQAKAFGTRLGRNKVQPVIIITVSDCQS